MGGELVRREPRNVGLAYALWLGSFFGFCGLHRIYAGRYASGIIWFFTGGLCGVGQLVDLFFVPRMVEDHNAGRKIW